MSKVYCTPAEVKIKKRDLKFGRDAPAPRWWHSNDPGRTAFFNALSSTFPLGEKFFMTAVRHYRDQAEEPLRSQIDDFIYQESMHSREHVVFNRQAEDAGYDMSRLEERTRKLIDWARRRSPLHQLAATCALEHYTAALAQHALANAWIFEGATEEARKLWQWHSIEEIEHKAVAYDTYILASKGFPAVRRWLKRSAAMLFATVRFHQLLFRNTADLLKQDGLNDWKTWKSLLRYLYGQDGLMRRLFISSFSYMRPNFHPWDEDDRDLLARSTAMLADPKPAGAVG